MKPDNTNPYPDHQDIVQLLPWYVNKTLHSSENKAVEAHLGVCLTCKRELTQLNKLAHAIVMEAGFDSPEHASFKRLKMRLHHEQEVSLQQRAQVDAPRTSGTFAFLGEWLKKQNRFQFPVSLSALAIAASFLLTLSVLIPNYTGHDDLQFGNVFKTLSDAQTSSIRPNEIRVVFVDNIDDQQKSTILDRVKGKIFDKPTAQGVYTVRLAEKMTDKHLLNVVDLLRKDSGVVFAEPAYALLSSARAEK